jgi:hypothetical protein
MHDIPVLDLNFKIHNLSHQFKTIIQFHDQDNFFRAINIFNYDKPEKSIQLILAR